MSEKFPAMFKAATADGSFREHMDRFGDDATINPSGLYRLCFAKGWTEAEIRAEFTTERALATIDRDLVLARQPPRNLQDMSGASK